jgi:hypothetical protein
VLELVGEPVGAKRQPAVSRHPRWTRARTKLAVPSVQASGPRPTRIRSTGLVDFGQVSIDDRRGSSAHAEGVS